MKVQKLYLYLYYETDRSKRKVYSGLGTLGSSWGINRIMAQVHALLLIAPDSLSAEDIMEELKISRGNANMNIRALPIPFTTSKVWYPKQIKPLK